MVMINSNRTSYAPNYPSPSPRVFPKEGRTKVPDLFSKQAYNSGGRPNPSNQYSNNYPSASEYNVRTRTGHLDVVVPGLDG